MSETDATGNAGLEATTAFPGDALELVAEVQDAKPADRVRFAVTAPDGRVLDVLEATVDAAGLARAPWVVEPGQLALPVELTFVADCLGETRTAAALRVEPPELKAAVAWHLAADDAGATDGISVEELGQPALALGEVVGTQVPEGMRLVVWSEVGVGGLHALGRQIGRHGRGARGLGRRCGGGRDRRRRGVGGGGAGGQQHHGGQGGEVAHGRSSKRPRTMTAPGGFSSVAGGPGQSIS